MIENQEAISTFKDARTIGAKYPLVDGKDQSDSSKIDSATEICSHIYHIYHINNVENIHQIHHIYPPDDKSAHLKLGSLKSPFTKSVLEEVNRPLTVDAASLNDVGLSALQQLSALLPVVNNSITINSGSLPLIGDLLKALNDGNPIEIVNVAKEDLKSVEANGISIAGKTSLMGEANVAISADIQPNGDYRFEVDFPSSSLRNFLTLSSLDLPPSFDISLPETYVIISNNDNILKIVAAAKGSLGEVSIQGTKEENKEWEFTAGIDLAASNFSSISVLKPLAAFDDFVGLTDIVMILSSQSAPEFDFPDTDQFGVPDLSWGKIKLPDGAGGLVEGFNLYATLSTAKSEAFRALAKFLNINLDGSVTIELSVSLPNPETNSKLFISFSQDNVTKGLLNIKGTFGGVLLDEEVGVEMTATALAFIQNQRVEFDVSAVAVETGAFITGEMHTDENPLWFTIDGIKFSIAEIALLIGINDEGIPSLGFSATIDIGNIQASASLFLDSVVPENSMFAASISRLSYYDVASSIVGQRNIPDGLANVLKKIGLEPLPGFTVSSKDAQPLITALNNRDLPTIAGFFSQQGITIPSTSDQLLLDINIKGTLWYLTDLSNQMLHYELNAGSDGSVSVSLEPQFYCCPQDTQIGSITYTKGFHLYAKLDYYFIAAEVKIEGQGDTGISADVTLDKIIIGHEKFLVITDANNGDTGPQFTMSTYAQGSQPPHISISGALHVLGMCFATDLNITEDGLDFTLGVDISPDYHFELSGTVGDLRNMHLDGTATLKINETFNLGKLGKVPFEAGVDGSLDLEVKNGVPTARVNGAFNYGKDSLKTGWIDLDYNSDSLEDLASKLCPYIEQQIEKVFINPSEWINAIKNGAIQGINGADQIAGVLNSEFKINASTASKLLSQSGCSIDEIANSLKGVYKLSIDQIADTISTSLNISYEEVFNQLEKLFGTGMPHVDSGTHIDTHDHIDKGRTDHVDTHSHDDTGGGDHVDRHWRFARHDHHDDTHLPHVDSGHHDDTALPHDDTSLPHIDQRSHGDTAQHFRLETKIAPPPTQAQNKSQAVPSLADQLLVRPAQAPITPSTNPLKVPYCDQMGLADGQRYWREGFSASSAMLAMYWGKESNEIVYDKLRRRYADSSSAEAQLDALRSLGLKADFHTDGTTILLKHEIDAGRPVAVAWLCDGPVSAPSGGGHWSVIVGYDETGFFVNDPYGICDLVDGGYLNSRDGVRIHYSYQYWVPRWRVEGTGGWMLTSRP